jgi:hypothetical protein
MLLGTRIEQHSDDNVEPLTSAAKMVLPHPPRGFFLCLCSPDSHGSGGGFLGQERTY